MMKSRSETARARAEELGLSALVFMTEDGDRLGRFLGESGLSPQQLSARASDPEMLAAVLDYLLADESLLMVFAATADVSPESIAPARALLPGGDEELAASGGVLSSDRQPTRTSPKKNSKRWAGPGSS
jgi:Protein of unknown function (DUF3572)